MAEKSRAGSAVSYQPSAVSKTALKGASLVARQRRWGTSHPLYNRTRVLQDARLRCGGPPVAHSALAGKPGDHHSGF